MQIDLTARHTWLHKINPSVKLILMVVLFILVLFIHNLNVLINYTLGFLVLFWFFSGHPFKRILLFSLPFILIFISTSTSMIFFGKGDTTWFKFGLIHITEESFYRGVHLGFRALCFASLGLTFALTTRPVMLFYSLMQQLKLSPKYAYSFMAGLRLMPIMIEEFQTIRYAMKIRGVESERGIRSFYKKLTAYSIPMLSQCIRRAHRIAVAMEAKKFTGQKERTFYYQINFSKYDFVFLTYIILVITTAVIIGTYFPYFIIGDVRYMN